MAIPNELLKTYMPHDEAMERVGLSRTQFFEKRRQGIFECRRINNRVLVKRSDIERYLKNLEVA